VREDAEKGVFFFLQENEDTWKNIQKQALFLRKESAGCF